MEQGNLPPQSPREASNTAASAHGLTATPQLMGYNHHGHSKPSHTQGGKYNDPLQDSKYAYMLRNHTFEDFIQSKRKALVMFYRTDSKDVELNFFVMSHYADVAKKNRNNYAYGYVDCFKDKQLCSYFNVNTFPTYMLFLDGQQSRDVITDPEDLPY